MRERFADRAAEQGRAISIDAPEDLTVWGDPLRLRQALGNLLDNALRHGEGDVVLTARQRECLSELEVSDEGVGFASDIAGRAFERFSRGDEARGRSGTGLGLAIVGAVAAAHGGEAAIVSGPRATVRVSLPAEEATGPPETAAATPASGKAALMEISAREPSVGGDRPTRSRRIP